MGLYMMALLGLSPFPSIGTTRIIACLVGVATNFYLPLVPKRVTTHGNKFVLDG